MEHGFHYQMFRIIWMLLEKQTNIIFLPTLGSFDISVFQSLKKKFSEIICHHDFIDIKRAYYLIYLTRLKEWRK